jgi:RNA polymerase sigma-70 factor (ECF subfamily)
MTRQEFEIAINKIRAKLLLVARHFVKSSGIDTDEEDIVQEALAELWTLFDNGYPIRNAEALAVKITKTVCVRHYRRRKPSTIPIDGVDCSGGAPASEEIELKDILKTKKMLYDLLTDTQRKYLTMRNEQDMSLDEIAAETGKPKSSIKAAISQARKIMMEQLKKM